MFREEDKDLLIEKTAHLAIEWRRANTELAKFKRKEIRFYNCRQGGNMAPECQKRRKFDN